MKIAPTGSRIMISGPAGTGKEVIARLIHENSYRKSGPFVVVNSAMMRPDSLEMELFGTEQGYPIPIARGGSEHLSGHMAAHYF